jgi:hypothetical protein
MDRVIETMRRLHARGPASRGVVVDADGAMLGPECVLVRKTGAGYRCLGREDAAAIQKLLLPEEEDADPDRLHGLSRGIAEALSKGEVALAQIYGLRIPITGLDSRQIEQLAAAARFAKANFNPDEPRDERGRWTDAGGGVSGAVPLVVPAAAGGDGTSPIPPVISTAAAATVADQAAGSIFGAMGRVASAGLAELAAGIAAPAAFLGVLFLPTNSSLVSEGTLPGRPDLGWRYDQDTGLLQIYRQDAAGRLVLRSGRVADGGLFYDEDGRVIGRNLGGTVAIDPDALPPPIGRTGTRVGAASASGQDRPKLCPDRSEENIAGRSERSLAYQHQISGLPRGLEVKLNGVRFDGCRESDGTMLEAKGPGYADKMEGARDWKDWFTGSEAIEEQMRAQSRAAAGRVVEWHFAEQPVADRLRVFAVRSNLRNIVIIHTPPTRP